MQNVITLINGWLTPIPQSLQPYVFFLAAASIILLVVRMLRGVILALIAITLILVTLYLSSRLFGFPLLLT